MWQGREREKTNGVAVRVKRAKVPEQKMKGGQRFLVRKCEGGKCFLIKNV